jgi:hypothetical protein
MSLQSEYQLAESADFRGKLKVAFGKAAITIIQDSTHQNYPRRVALVRELMRNPEDWIARLSYFVVASGLDGSSTDLQIIQRVVMMWDAFAGTDPQPPAPIS